MTRVVAAIAAIGAFLTAPALAADMAVKAPPKSAAIQVPAAPDWTGVYLGGHLGYLWGHTVIDEAATGGLVVLGPTNGVVGGVLGGVNWQIEHFVFGGEADIGWSNANGNGVAVSSDIYTYKIQSTSHVRGRIGYDSNGTLFFVAGGLAVAQAHVQEIEATVAASGGTYVGASIGGGVEQIFTPQVSARIEYLYDDFGHKNYTTADDSYRVGVTGQTVRGALIIRFPVR